MQLKVCVHIISLTNGWNLTKLAQIHLKDGEIIYYIIVTLTSFSRLLHYKYTKSELTSTDSLLGHGKEVFRFL